ncbi:MAG: hypothetical protein KGI49_02400 [Patescibacteria group bacterium]|nr:hypothetical protein [Patescibacteria group bacterium]
MKSIKEFLSSISDKRTRELIDRGTAKKVIADDIGIDEQKISVSFKNGAVIIVGLSQAAKTAIYIKKDGLVAKLSTVLPNRAIRDIR